MTKLREDHERIEVHCNVRYDWVGWGNSWAYKAHGTLFQLTICFDLNRTFFSCTEQNNVLFFSFVQLRKVLSGSQHQFCNSVAHPYSHKNLPPPPSPCQREDCCRPIIDRGPFTQKEPVISLILLFSVNYILWHVSNVHTMLVDVWVSTLALYHLCRSDRAILPHPCNAANCECLAEVGLQAVWCFFGGCPVSDRHSKVLLRHPCCPVCHGAAGGATHQCTFQTGPAWQGKQEELGQVRHWSPVHFSNSLCYDGECIVHCTVHWQQCRTVHQALYISMLWLVGVWLCSSSFCSD